MAIKGSKAYALHSYCSMNLLIKEFWKASDLLNMNCTVYMWLLSESNMSWRLCFTAHVHTMNLHMYLSESSGHKTWEVCSLQCLLQNVLYLRRTSRIKINLMEFPVLVLIQSYLLKSRITYKCICNTSL